MVIVVGGMIGLGKSSVAKILGEYLNSDVFYESVDDNPILPLFYSESEEEINKKRYPFLLQLYFLNTRFKSIKEALVNDNNVLDRIKLRGRDFEVDDDLKDYYEFLWKDYDDWVQNHYKASEVLIIDMDKMDVVNNKEDEKELVRLVKEKLEEVRGRK